MTKYFCDRCGREIENAAYIISISLKPTKYDIYQHVAETSINVVNIQPLEPPIYCSACKEEFEKFLKGE